MKTKMMAATLLMAAGSVYAQNAIVNTVPGTFVDISLNAGAVNLLPAASLTTSASYDDCSFSFTSSVSNSMFAASTVRACSNGFVQFGGTLGSTGFSNASIAAGTASPLSTTAQALLPFWDDQVLYVNSTANPSNGRLQYLIGDCATLGITATTGQVLIVQWTREDLFGTANATNATYQVQVFQNPFVAGGTMVCAQMLYSNVIFNTGTLAGSANNGGGSATIGYVAGNTGGVRSQNNVQWSLNTTTGVSNGTVLSVSYVPSPIPPSLAGATATPSTGGAGSPVAITVNALGGQFPNSSTLTVTADMASLGGVNGAPMTFVSGNQYTISGLIPATATDFAPTTSTVTIHCVDDLARTATDATVTVTGQGAVTWDETANGGGDAGDLPGTAQVVAGSGPLNVITGSHTANDVDMYKINISDAANFQATTRFGGSAIDTQLFLFNSAGLGVAMDDDSPTGVTPASNSGTLTSTLVSIPGLTNGDYYIAVCRYDRDPVNAGGFPIWEDTPFGTVRAPDGLTAGGDFTITGWDASATTATGAYRLSFVGASMVTVAPPVCSIADMGVQGGVPGQDRLLDNNDFIVFIDYFFNANPIADVGIQGGVPGTDGQFDNNDFIVFIDYFFNDQANCTG